MKTTEATLRVNTDDPGFVIVSDGQDFHVHITGPYLQDDGTTKFHVHTYGAGRVFGNDALEVVR